MYVDLLQCTLYTLSLHNVICQLFLNKAGGKTNFTTLLPIQNTFLTERGNITQTHSFMSAWFLGDPVWLQKGMNNP